MSGTAATRAVDSTHHARGSDKTGRRVGWTPDASLSRSTIAAESRDSHDPADTADGLRSSSLTLEDRANRRDSPEAGARPRAPVRAEAALKPADPVTTPAKPAPVDRARKRPRAAHSVGAEDVPEGRVVERAAQDDGRRSSGSAKKARARIQDTSEDEDEKGAKNDEGEDDEEEGSKDERDDAKYSFKDVVAGEGREDVLVRRGAKGGIHLVFRARAIEPRARALVVVSSRSTVAADARPRVLPPWDIEDLFGGLSEPGAVVASGLSRVMKEGTFVSLSRDVPSVRIARVAAAFAQSGSLDYRTLGVVRTPSSSDVGEVWRTMCQDLPSAHCARIEATFAPLELDTRGWVALADAAEEWVARGSADTSAQRELAKLVDAKLMTALRISDRNLDTAIESLKAWVAHSRPDGSGLRGAPFAGSSLLGPFIGTAPEEYFAEVARSSGVSKDGRIVFVVGVSGIGKTKLSAAPIVLKRAFSTLMLTVAEYTGDESMLLDPWQELVTFLDSASRTIPAGAARTRVVVAALSTLVHAYVRAAIDGIARLRKTEWFRDLHWDEQACALRDVVYFVTKDAHVTTEIGRNLRTVFDGLHQLAERADTDLVSKGRLLHAINELKRATGDSTLVFFVDEVSVLVGKLPGLLNHAEARAVAGAANPATATRSRTPGTERDVYHALLVLCRHVMGAGGYTFVLAGTQFSVVETGISKHSPVQDTNTIFARFPMLTVDTMAAHLEREFGLSGELVRDPRQRRLLQRLVGRPVFFVSDLLRSLRSEEGSRSDAFSEHAENAWIYALDRMYRVVSSIAHDGRITAREFVPRRRLFAELAWADRMTRGRLLTTTMPVAERDRALALGLLSQNPLVDAELELDHEPVVRAALRDFVELTMVRDADDVTTWVLRHRQVEVGSRAEMCVAWSIVRAVVRGRGGLPRLADVLDFDGLGTTLPKDSKLGRLVVAAKVGFDFRLNNKDGLLPTSFHALFKTTADGALALGDDERPVPLLGRLVFDPENSANGPDVMFWAFSLREPGTPSTRSPCRKESDARRRFVARATSAFFHHVTEPVDNDADDEGVSLSAVDPASIRLVMVQVKMAEKGISEFKKSLSLDSLYRSLDDGNVTRAGYEDLLRCAGRPLRPVAVAVTDRAIAESLRAESLETLDTESPLVVARMKRPVSTPTEVVVRGDVDAGSGRRGRSRGGGRGRRGPVNWWD